LPYTIGRRRVYILPTRYGIMLALMLVAMLIAGLNYNSNLGLGFAFLMISIALVGMHHCNRNLLRLTVDAAAETDGFAGGWGEFRITLRNDSGLERYDVEVRIGDAAPAMQTVPAQGECAMSVAVPLARRGVARFDRFELRTRHPFGWFSAWTYVQAPLTAFAAPEPRGERALRAAAGTAGDQMSSEPRGDEDFDGLRSYEAGVPLKHMAWKVLARGGEPAVRSYSALAAAPEWLDWEWLADLDTEERLSQLCRWVLAGDAARHRYGLRLPGVAIEPADGAEHRTRCLRALASFAATPAARVRA
jgi:uncharacterized protein (DUF58 family)